MNARVKCPTEIAILMATYNGEKFLREQIDSIIKQTNNNWTLYIHDDGSTDSTLSIVQQYCREHENIIFLEDEVKGRGAAQSFFYMLESIDSLYYMFCDQDDYWQPDKVEVSYSQLYANSGGGGIPL